MILLTLILTCSFHIVDVPPQAGFGYTWFQLVPDDNCSGPPYEVVEHNGFDAIAQEHHGEWFVIAAGPEGTYTLCVKNNQDLTVCRDIKLPGYCK